LNRIALPEGLMEALTFKQWIAVATVITLALIPIAWYYWKIWDRPSRAAKEEMARRKHEAEVREMFQREELKLRAEEAKQAKLAMMRKKAAAPNAVPKNVLNAAFGDLADMPMDPEKSAVASHSGNSEMVGGQGGKSGDGHGEREVRETVDDAAMTEELTAVDVPRIHAMLDDLPDVEFDEESIHEGPIAVQLLNQPVPELTLSNDSSEEKKDSTKAKTSGNSTIPSAPSDEWDIGDW